MMCVCLCIVGANWSDDLCLPVAHEAMQGCSWCTLLLQYKTHNGRQGNAEMWLHDCPGSVMAVVG